MTDTGNKQASAAQITKPSPANRLAHLLPLGDGAWKPLLWWVIGIYIFKLLYFDLLWALDTTFSGFQFWQGYMTKLAFATICASPLLLWRNKWCAIAVALVLDLWLTANLMYFRTYFTVIPASSYGLAGNLADFTDSVTESLRPADAGFFATTVLLAAALWRAPIKQIIKTAFKKIALRMTLFVLLPLTAVGASVLSKGGYRSAYEKLMYDYSTCGAAVYTIPGAMAYEWLKGSLADDPAVRADIDAWLAARPEPLSPTPPAGTVPDNCIILLLESFESWPIGLTLEGHEITPNLNRLVADSTTFYAPHVQDQVRGGRSIDAQLILHTGVLPVEHGVYSYRFVHNTYPSLDKAWKEKYGTGARAMSFTVDKRTVWNVLTVAQDFGYEIFDRPEWRNDERTGPRGRLGDDSFLRQAVARIGDDTFWDPRGHNLLQIVTYSGHTPFTIPRHLIKIKLSDKVPQRLRHYLEVANYTDRAIGRFLASLKANPKFAGTMVVITGDHEGIGTDRTEFLKNPYVRPWLSPDQTVPLIVANGPAHGRMDAVMGQVDIYPTLLDMLGLQGYFWHGVGQSALNPARYPVAVTARGKITGDDSGMTPAQKQHARQIFAISDLIVASDYFAPAKATAKNPVHENKDTK